MCEIVVGPPRSVNERISTCGAFGLRFASDPTGCDLLSEGAREHFDKFHATATLTISDFKVFHLSNVENPLLAETKLLQGSGGAGKGDKRWFHLQEPSLEWQPFFEAM